jgi:carbon-monoxide dehydrogenase iron sulfur subunit
VPVRVLVADPKRCTGCMFCRTVCAMSRSGVGRPVLSRIRIVSSAEPGRYLPIVCQHCQDAPCVSVCPRKALGRDERLQRITVDYDRCISCKMCVAACPFGAVGFDADRDLVFKCDLCDGQPECVRFCFYGALTFELDYRQPCHNLHQAAHRATGGKALPNPALDRPD